MFYNTNFNNLPTILPDPLSKELTKYQLSLVSFGRFKPPKAHSVSNTSLPYHRLIYITGSSILYQIHGSTMILEKGDVLYTPPNTIYSAASVAENTTPEFLYLYFEVLPCHEEQPFIEMMEDIIRKFSALLVKCGK